MCGGPERSSNEESTETPSRAETTSDTKDMKHLTVETEDCFSSLLELAANDDIEGFKSSVERDASSIDEVGFWYSRQKGSKQIVLEHRTPLMVAATYGSVDVLELILSKTQADVNFSCGMDKTTALHCAASGGSAGAVDAVKLLLSAGANPNAVDANGHRPIDVITVPPKLHSMRFILEGLLSNGGAFESAGGTEHYLNGNGERSLRVSVMTSSSSSPTHSSSPGNGSPPSPSVLVYSPMASKFSDQPLSSATEKKEYPIDPSLPDIKNSIYATDEFRMYSFKVRPCSRAYSHDWTECPFVHPGENARRRDPRKFHYSCVPCPDFRKGACRRGDMCEYAHGVFECWLHPAQYRTRLCKDGTSCNRRVCFFAHLPEELRPLYVSTGSAVPSPRSSAASVMDMAAALSMLPGSPSSMSAMSPTQFNQQQPMSPSVNGISHSSGGWPQPNVPTLHLPGSNLQSSRLRSSLCARDIPPHDFDFLKDFDAQQHILNDLTCFSQSRNNSASLNRSGRPTTLTPSNLEELFSAELSSPRYASDQGAASFSPTHKLHQFQQQQQSMLSPINTSVFSPKNVEHPFMQAPFGVGSPGRMSPRSMDPLSPMNGRLSAVAAHRERQQQQQQHQQFRSLSSRDLGVNNPVVGSPVGSRTNWGSPSGKLDWSVSGEELGRLKRSSSFENGTNGEEPDLSWVQSLVKESPPEMTMRDKYAAAVADSSSGDPNTEMDSLMESLALADAY
ncbi:Zinc finger CCCH domain-containing protein 30 [Linum perenne]